MLPAARLALGVISGGLLKLASLGAETAGGTPEQFAAEVRKETAKRGKVIKDAGVRTE